MSDFVVREAVLPALTAATKEAAIREMVESLRASGHIKASEQENIIKAIMKREQLGTTGIGRGVAIPHTKHEGVERLMGTVAVSHAGVPFDSLDSEPVHIFVLLVSPQDRPTEHLRALDNVSRNLRDDMFCRFLRQATTKEAIWELLTEAEQGGNR
jgi:PTS system fructose-specific IIA component/PTS system nitrogen regulatory IIA component